MNFLLSVLNGRKAISQYVLHTVEIYQKRRPGKLPEEWTSATRGGRVVQECVCYGILDHVYTVYIPYTAIQKKNNKKNK